MSTVLQHGYLPQPYLGVRLQPIRLDDALRQKLARSGSDAVIVVGIEPDSPAAAANLLLGDVLAAIGGRPIENALDLKIALSRIPLGSVSGTPPSVPQRTAQMPTSQHSLRANARCWG